MLAGPGDDVTAPEPTQTVLTPSTGAPPIVIRPIRIDDKQALRDGCDRLSDRSRYRRFLSAHGTLTSAELNYFTEVEHHDHEALVAIDSATGEGVGVARYVRSRLDPSVAELAVAVADDWQGQGVGSRLVGALADRASQEGIKSFTATMLADNRAVLNLMRELGVEHDVHSGDGLIELTVDLPEHGVGGVARRAGSAPLGADYHPS